MGIEPTYPAWKAGVLPLNYTRTFVLEKIAFLKSGWQDSNLRPPGPKPGALAKLSHTPFVSEPPVVLSNSLVFRNARVIIYDGSNNVNCFFEFFLFFYLLLKWKVYFHFE